VNEVQLWRRRQVQGLLAIPLQPLPAEMSHWLPEQLARFPSTRLSGGLCAINGSSMGRFERCWPYIALPYCGRYS
jgi:hypothetical protein